MSFITKEDILKKVSQREIYSHYLGTNDFSRNLKNPFVAKDKTPSMKINSDWTFKCFNSEHKGDVIQFVAYQENLDNRREYHKILLKINDVFNLGLNENSSNETILLQKKHYKSYSKEFTPEALTFWESLKVSKTELEKYKVSQLDKFTYYNKKSKKHLNLITL